jgi:aromatic-L-amino-acid/L-tryptophan decarboxylase
MNLEEFRRHGHALIDWLADYHQTLAARPVQATTRPGTVRAMLPADPPENPEGFESCIADLDTVVAPNLSHWQHPRFFGYFPANALLAGVLGDLVSTGLGTVGLSWQSSPALSEVEEVVTDWVRKMVDLSPQWVGVISDTASTSTLVAMICARERTTNYGLAKGGLQAEASPLVVYASAGSHSCVEKGALLAGLGRENIRMIPLDDRHGMRQQALRESIEQDIAAGLRPCAIAACVGGTATASIDPIREIADIGRRYDLWLHVDAAMAGSAMILPECRWMWDGIEGADSVVINAHKWLGAPFDCSLYYVRDEQHLMRVMSTNPSFLQSKADGQVRNLRDTGIPLGRRFRALKLWFLIREQGVSGLQARLRRDLANARRLTEMVSATPGWAVVAPVHLQTVCVRHEPDGLTGAALDAYTRAWADAVNSSGEGYLTPAMVDGRWLVRISIGAPGTEWADVTAIWAAIQRHAGESLKRAESAPRSQKVARG